VLVVILAAAMFSCQCTL